MDPDPEINLKMVPRKQRAVIRQSLRNDLEARKEQDVAHFYDIYSESVHNLGTPVFSRRYFEALLAVFNSCSEIITIFDRGKPLASVLTFFFRDEVIPYYGGGVAGARPRAAYDFMYWTVMSRAAASGYLLFDFGRSKLGTGSFNFKKNWGFEPEALIYEFKLRGKGAVPDLNPLNPKYRPYIELWKRLPLPVTRILGPRIARGLP